MHIRSEKDNAPIDLQEARENYCALPRMYQVVKCDVDAYIMDNLLGRARQEHEFVKLLLQFQGKDAFYICVHWGKDGLGFQHFKTHAELAAAMPRPLRSAAQQHDIASFYDLMQHSAAAVYFDDILCLCEALQQFPYHLLQSNCRHFSRLIWELVYQLSGSGNWFKKQKRYHSRPCSVLGSVAQCDGLGRYWDETKGKKDWFYPTRDCFFSQLLNLCDPPNEARPHGIWDRRGMPCLHSPARKYFPDLLDRTPVHWQTAANEGKRLHRGYRHLAFYTRVYHPLLEAFLDLD